MALSAAPFAIERVAFEHHLTALGIGEASPRISWAFEGQPSGIQNWTQSSYSLEISLAGHSEPEIFVVNSSESSLVPWPTTPLSSGESAEVRVQSFGGNGIEDAETPWSDVFHVEAGLLDEEAWEGAVFISAEERLYQNRTRQPILFRKSFDVPAEVGSARLYITARGLFSAEVNGQAVGDEVLAPGWQSYHHRLQYSTFDVTDLIRAGGNAVGAQLGEGWYAGRIGVGEGERNGWGDKLELLALLVITGTDGERHLIRTDSSWDSGFGAIQASEIYDGEVYDFRKAQRGWSGPGFTPSNGSMWAAVAEVNSSLDVVSAPNGPPIRRTQTVELKEVLTTPSGRTVLDFGQNFAGWLRLRVEGPKGTNITMVHVEVLENDEIATRPLRTAKQTDSVILSGDGVETWEPSFTYHGFRYVQVDGWPTNSTELSKESVIGIAVHSDMREIGSFESSSPILNKLHQNIKWSMRSNFMGVPTDCPQRDERLGWTGDAHTFASTANFLYDTSGFWKSWMQDVCSEQVDGIIPVVVPAPPSTLPGMRMPTAIWSDATVVIPWEAWMSTGDIDLLQSQYQCVRNWIDRGVPRIDSGLWDRDAFQFGDWLDPAAPPDDPGAASTSPAYVADAYLIYVTGLLAQIAAALGLDDDAARYDTWASNLTEAFQEAWIYPNGTAAYETQTGLVLPLHFSLFSDPQHPEAAVKRLQTNIADNDYKIGTGFAGTHLIGHTLTRYGLSDTFYEMLFQTESPSWLYQVDMGGTTTWERWDSMLPDGTINTGEMTSFNHYSHGSVASWIHGKVGGLEPLEPGWKRFRVHVIPGGPVESAKTTYHSPYGRVSASWRIYGDDFILEVEVPPNSVAEIILPGEDPSTDPSTSKVVGSGTYNFTSTGW